MPAISHPDGETAAWWFRDGAAQAAATGLIGAMPAGGAEAIVRDRRSGLSEDVRPAEFGQAHARWLHIGKGMMTQGKRGAMF